MFDRGVVDVDQLTMDRRSLLEEWQDSHVTRQLKPRTRALLMVAAQQYLRFLARQGLVDNRLQWSLDRPRIPRSLPHPIPSEDLRRLVLHLLPRRPMMPVLDLRDRAMFFYFLATSARASEALQVRRDQLERQVVVQKGGDEKLMRIPAIVQVIVSDYLAARDDDCVWLWATHENNLLPRRLDVPGVREAWGRLCWKVGVPRFNSRQIRSTGATVLYDMGLDVLEVAQHLGHRGLAHAQDYIALTNRRERPVDAMQSFILSVIENTPNGHFRRGQRPRLA